MLTVSLSIGTTSLYYVSLNNPRLLFLYDLCAARKPNFMLTYHGLMLMPVKHSVSIHSEM